MTAGPAMSGSITHEGRAGATPHNCPHDAPLLSPNRCRIVAESSHIARTTVISLRLRRFHQDLRRMSVDWFELAYRVLGGLCVFLFGMKALSESLQALASDFIRKVIGWLTTNRFMAVAVGLVVTCIIQSSSVTTVMVVGLL